MSVSILEALQNADYNLNGNNPFQHNMGKEQLHNATILLEKGYSIYDQVEEIMAGHKTVEDVPDKPDEE